MIERQSATILGLHTGYSVVGAGPKVVMMHGGRLGYSLDIWNEISDQIATSGFQALAVDMPGYGVTDIPTDQSASFTWKFLIGFVEKVCGTPVHIVGHSNSGGPAVRFGLERPDLARSIVVAGTGSLMPVTLGIAASLRKQLPSDDELLSEPTLEETRLDFLQDVYDAKVLTHERVELLNEMSRGKNFEAARLRKVAAGSNREQDRKGVPLWQRLDELKMPVMAVFGDGDKNRAVERLPMLAERYPNIEVHLLEHCKHLIQWDAPIEFVSLLTDFFQRVEQGPIRR